MEHLIIYAHPNSKDSFNKAILDAVVRYSDTEKTIIRDLYQLHFNPILTMGEIPGTDLPNDIVEEQQFLTKADLITFIYPLWWMGFPAILKGYIDRVFSHGFAYETVNSISKGLLTGKKIQHIVTLGSKVSDYEQLGFIDGLKVSLLDGLFNFCGIYDIKYKFYGNIHNLTAAERQQILDEISENIQKV